MKVHGHPLSTCTRKVLATLAEKGREAELVLVDLTKGEQKSPTHLARHPFGVIPTLEDDDGFVLYESRAIIRYLDRVLPGPSLTPAAPKAYGLMEQFISVEQYYFTPSAFKVTWERLFKPHMGGGPVDEARVAEGRQGVAKVFAILDPVLAKQPFLAGDSFSLAEVAWLPDLAFFLTFDEEKALLAEHKHVAAWWERISGRPAWRKVTGA
ncbi:glutathione S-transferase family protein [Myxococcus fulvus]|uniref:glutathione S-transferase family protein n=1 Tax=Myxococcus fulvus TaxID=33 RepID=UPI003B9A6BB0